MPKCAKWVASRRCICGFEGVHWTSWQALKGARRMVWLTWEGCGAPWDKSIHECPICDELHGTTVHAHLIHCDPCALRH